MAAFLSSAVQANPSLPVVERLEDLWLLSRLQQERKAQQQQQQPMPVSTRSAGADSTQQPSAQPSVGTGLRVRPSSVQETGSGVSSAPALATTAQARKGSPGSATGLTEASPGSTTGEARSAAGTESGAAAAASGAAVSTFKHSLDPVDVSKDAVISSGLGSAAAADAPEAQSGGAAVETACVGVSNPARPLNVCASTGLYDLD
jgi:hypothetical protein